MLLAIVAVVILLMKIADIGPVAHWSWFYVLLPFVLLFIWWEWLAKLVGWDRREAEKRRQEEMKEAEEWKKKRRGF